MKTATKTTAKSQKPAKMFDAVELPKTVKPSQSLTIDALPKVLPIGVNEVGLIEVTTPKGRKGIKVVKSAKAFVWYKSESETIRFDLRSGKSKDEETFVNPKSYKRDYAATVKALQTHRLMKLEAQQRYLAKQK